MELHEVIRKMRDDDKAGKTQISKYVSISAREDIDKTEAYLNSKHISGDTDYLGHKKPFFNICVSARNIWFRATDIDCKSLSFKAEKKTNVIKAFLATILFQDWMRKVNFGQFLNDWGLTLASHGSAVCKFIEKGKELSTQVLDWNNLLFDPVDFEGNIVVERLWFTPSQLKKQNYDKELVDNLIKNLVTRKTMDDQEKDTKDGYIEVFEVHGEMPLSYYTGKEKDKDTFKQMMIVISFQKNDDGTFDDYILFKGKEAKSPYMLTHLIKKDGQTYVGGAVKNLFDAQWQINHTEKMILDHLELASKQLFQTADGSYLGKNVMNNIKNGAILTYSPGNPLTQLNNRPDTVAMSNYKVDWQNQGAQVNGISEAMMGVTPPSGSAWRQTQAMLQESHSLFELMTENKSLAIKDMGRLFFLPFFKKQMDTSDEISAILTDHQIEYFDSVYVPNEAIRQVNQKKKDTILSGQIYATDQEPVDLQNATQSIQKELQGNQRFIKPSDIKDVTWKEVMKDLELELDLDPTQESKDIQGTMATYQTALNFLMSLQGRPMTPDEKMIFNNLIGLTGTISPLQLSFNQKSQPVSQPMAGKVGGQGALQLTPQ